MARPRSAENSSVEAAYQEVEQPAKEAVDNVAEVVQ